MKTEARMSNVKKGLTTAAAFDVFIEFASANPKVTEGTESFTMTSFPMLEERHAIQNIIRCLEALGYVVTVGREFDGGGLRIFRMEPGALEVILACREKAKMLSK